jgi:hypothetical protein
MMAEVDGLWKKDDNFDNLNYSLIGLTGPLSNRLTGYRANPAMAGLNGLTGKRANGQTG